MSVPGNLVASIEGVSLIAATNPAGLSNYENSYEVSPILLVGGIAANAQGGVLPISQFLGAPDGGGSFRFVVIPGGMLISNAIGTYPFANQQVAANAVIQQPLPISLLMIAPVREEEGGYYGKLALFTSLQNTLQAHNNAGGSYNVVTPAYIYQNCLLPSLQDVTSGETKQKQVHWQWDFTQPLITPQQAQQAYNSLMGKAAAGQQVTSSSWSNNNSLSGTPQSNASSLAPQNSGSAITYPTGP
ncbi:hypothetical protein [Dyella caseinilytica]|uniref:Uncharacterized protein n=1 Tax=Dyella caseinilytica TaxID=1849581 RepID=A0ABX7GZ04_9GAMM|nr:hypothetical protein [Dyella caseinilytica]QRN55258.1 hypothetical protein ISN74_07990 [Dyella caseinilytica]GGA00502.1 hypothetical protein GCM10011408_21770 [Dyella caseinilytica]